MNISDIGELGFINKLIDIFGTNQHQASSNHFSCEGIGDDCAIIDIDENQSLVITTDMLVENVHFLRNAISPLMLGRKSLSVNLSDVAAMGAKPFASFLSIALPKNIEQSWIDQFIEGYRQVSAENNTLLLGGDTVNGEALTINVTAIGVAPKHQIKRRSTAQVGDLIMITGSIGESAAGLQLLLEHNYSSSPAHQWTSEQQRLIDLHHNPLARTKEGQWLGSHSEVRAMLDLSDGLLNDIKHITRKFGARIQTNRIPTSVDIKTAICGGEDYQLLFTVSPNNVDAFLEQYRKEFGYTPYIIGEIIDGEGVIWEGLDDKTISELSSFSHF